MALTAEKAAPRRWLGILDVYFSRMESSSSVMVSSGMEPILDDFWFDQGSVYSVRSRWTKGMKGIRSSSNQIQKLKFGIKDSEQDLLIYQWARKALGVPRLMLLTTSVAANPVRFGFRKHHATEASITACSVIVYCI